jgi:hypothetical protein
MRFKERIDTGDEPELPFEPARHAFELSRQILDALSNEGPATKSAAAWENIIEQCNIIWGARPAIITLAIARVRPNLSRVSGVRNEQRYWLA